MLSKNFCGGWEANLTGQWDKEYLEEHLRVEVFIKKYLDEHWYVFGGAFLERSLMSLPSAQETNKPYQLGTEVGTGYRFSQTGSVEALYAVPIIHDGMGDFQQSEVGKSLQLRTKLKF